MHRKSQSLVQDQLENRRSSVDKTFFGSLTPFGDQIEANPAKTSSLAKLEARYTVKIKQYADDANSYALSNERLKRENEALVKRNRELTKLVESMSKQYAQLVHEN